MRYVIDISPELAEEVNRQVKAGKYKTPQDFMLAAIQNQAYLETVEVEGQLEPDILETLKSPTKSSLNDYVIQYKESTTTSQTPAVSSLATRTTAARLLLLPETSKVLPVPLGDARRHVYLSGLSNRLFPVKPVLRVLGNTLADSGSQYVVLDELQEKSAEVARELGRAIQRKDRSLGRKRGTIISAGLPIGREDKSMARFIDQFVGFIGKDKLEGAAPTLGFIDFRRDEKKVSAGITEPGLKFSALLNPIIDRQDYSTPFSDEETEFLLDHLATNLPGEAKLMRTILRSVNEGVARPDALNPKIRSQIENSHPPISDKPNWKDSEVIAERVGLISRMAELGLLNREKDGVKVTYRVSSRGRSYLTRLAKLES